MFRYLLLQNPGHNRVYYNFSDNLALAELKIACKKLDADCTDIEIINLANVRYLGFSTSESLSINNLQIISHLSFVFAIYLLDNSNDKPFLIPIEKCNYEYINQKISSILKYPGKTNELFTKMMINVALLSSDFNYNENLQLLDPVAGKGTTLFESIVYGFNATGVEIDSKSTHATQIFFKKFLEEERYKHNIDTRQVYGKNKAVAIYAKEFEFATSKEDFKNKQLRKKLSIVNGSSIEASKYFKKDSFHIIVGDLPYGVAHGNSMEKKAENITRNPKELLSQCLPQWHKVLKKGGVVVVAWNSFVISRNNLAEVFREHNFDVLSNEPYNDFEHMVDKSIKRDIVVAKKI